MRVGFIGAGRMGTPMVSRLVAFGHHVTALGRTPEKCDALTELGAAAASDHAAVADGADVVIVCVFTDEQVREICVEADLTSAMGPESVLVVHTTGSPHTAEQIAALAAPRHVGVIDAPVSGGPHDIAAAQLTVFAGGTDRAVAHARPALESYADPVLHVGPLGAGQRVKLINNTLFAAQIGLVAEGVRLGGRLGIDEPTLLKALVNGSAGSRALSGIAATGSADAFISRVGEFIGKDVAVVRSTAADLDTDLGLLDTVVDAGLR
ncbi:6-phosphogluconate dehydrogenase [Mycobacterium dioxanotrophicus]|jgi:3-hydroxyisobutyrate dehydrogenase-like beta-hydroxyacid dehydrogenase|uniref:6-phosphogluconate dehydrogenase n=1 Tax=Mycobacterium dioxanotrophicus TaxID=482462 RepID=A0A1Y0C1J8_9MYCO|nr:NAD(P)-dependent oxidoreductase [Mycobacterium dioxanotrophicus]ART68975.1 6-phosphogluconate dehydrogenase [Mycobacterium dioxanotrophicus]